MIKMKHPMTDASFLYWLLWTKTSIIGKIYVELSVNLVEQKSIIVQSLKYEYNILNKLRIRS
ncbi:MAG TPA: hypothetical protein DCM73_05800 [Clostridiales bacterium]|nr:hypothetical protein [Clostridiales bacterium]